jgi:hypothetical protein
MAIAALSFDTPATVPDAPASGKKLFLGADGRFFLVLPDGTQEPLLGNSSTGTVYSPTPPSDPTESMRWVDSNTLRAYEYVGGAWIEIVSS